MRDQFVPRLFLLLILTASLMLTSCTPAVVIVDSSTAVEQPAPAASEPQPSAPTPVVSLEMGGIDDPNVFVDPDEFIAALLQALMDQNTAQLQGWMTMPFITGGWRADASDSAPEDALLNLDTNYLGAENHLEWVKGADLVALMGGFDPLSLPRSDAGVFEAALVSGWGKDGRDEAVLFIARAADNSLKWQGWMVIQGGFSGARLGGIQPYANQTYGYSLYLPKTYEILETDARSMVVMAPGVGHPGEQRAAAFIYVEPANGRTVEQVVAQVKADAGPGFDFPPDTAMGLDKALALVVSGLPGQDVNRQLFVVYNDLLYHITFVPDTPKVGASYWQMEDLYAMIVNTFHFTN